VATQQAMGMTQRRNRIHDTLARIRPARRIWSIVVSLVCHGGVVVAAGSGMTAAEISAEIDAKGAKAVINRLATANVDAMGRSDWSRTMDQIWNGRLAYIALAPKLARGADSGPADDLGIALARALPVAPAAVLRVIDRHNGPVLGVDRVCGAPFIEPAAKDVSGYLRAARSAIDEVDAPRLQHVKAACVERLTLAAKQLDPRQGK
jgi:hypothetical protein